MTWAEYMVSLIIVYTYQIREMQEITQEIRDLNLEDQENSDAETLVLGER